jgi:Ni/Co efflux regulator RcnB
MKLQALMIAVALVAGTAFAQAPNSTAAATANANASMSGTAAASTDMKADMKAGEKAPTHKMHKKHVAKKRHHEKQAMAKHHRHHQLAMAHDKHHHLMASAHMNTRAMGAGPASPSVSLNSPAREHRMDSAYNDWLRMQHRR